MRLLAAPFRFVIQYFQGAYNEFRQVTWPTRQSLVQYTVLVTVTIVISAALLTAFDYGLEQLTTRYLIR